MKITITRTIYAHHDRTILEFMADLVKIRALTAKQAAFLSDVKDITLDNGTRVQLQGD